MRQKEAAGGETQHFEINLGAATLGDLGVARQGDAVAGRELHALRVVLLHESLAERVAVNVSACCTRCVRVAVSCDEVPTELTSAKQSVDA